MTMQENNGMEAQLLTCSIFWRRFEHRQLLQILPVHCIHCPPSWGDSR